MYKQYGMQFLRFSLLIVLLVTGYFILILSFPYVYPIIIALLFAYLMNPFVNFLQRSLHFPRALSVVISICIIFLSLFGFLLIVIFEIYQGTLFLADKLPIYFQEFVIYMKDFINTTILPIQQKILSFFLALDTTQQTTIKNSLEEIMNHIGTTGSTFLQDFLIFIPNFLGLLPNSIAIFIFIIIGTFIISNEWYSLKKRVIKLIPKKVNSISKELSIHFKKGIGGFMRAQFMLISISGITIFIGLLILNVDQALTIAIFSALVDLIPFVGIGIIFIPWIIYLFVSGNYALTIGLSILYMIVIISRQILEPKILSSNMGIHSLFALIGYFIGFKIWGFFGLIITPLILILINVCYQTGVFKLLKTFVKG
ncbi:sporulation integral membrane protein YtvI [Oceanobacillus sp. Castelsardo]|uniref:sporulation integral membrane protein YtvI n=1 Tax=Oceanobacillus sp. Castelsardo TaxID=1851204 RepID=UPI0008397148|nr:sporulation integral membrane protein YtvI [Oceanobacillus sp. Castelsardo]